MVVAAVRSGSILAPAATALQHGSRTQRHLRLRRPLPVVSCMAGPSAAAAAGGVDPSALAPSVRLASTVVLAAQASAARSTLEVMSGEWWSPRALWRLSSPGAKTVVRKMLMVPVSLGIGTTMPLITSSIASFIKLYLLLLFFRVLLSWFPNIDWDGQPWITLRQVTDPYLNIFRSLIPPIFNIDFTPLVGFIILNWLVGVLQGPGAKTAADYL